MFSIPDEWLEKYKDEKYYQVYDFKPPFNSENFLKKIPLSPGMAKTIDILANLGKGFNVIELAAGLRFLYKGITPDDVYEILRQLELRGYVTVSTVKKEVKISIPVIKKVVKCPFCNSHIALEVNLEELDFSKGYATISYIHGNPPHILILYINKDGSIRGVNVVKDVMILK